MTNKTKLQSKGNSLNTTVPSSIAAAMRLKKGDEIEFILLHGEVCIRKV